MGGLEFNHAMPPGSRRPGKESSRSRRIYALMWRCMGNRLPACALALAGWRVPRPEPMAGWWPGLVLVGGTLALARACSGAGAGAGPSNRGRLFCPASLFSCCFPG